MKVEIKINSASEIMKRIGLDKAGRVQVFHTQNVLRRIQKYMPFRTGQTIRNTIASTNISVPEIVTNEPYARYLYYGVSKTGKPLVYTKSKNPQAGPKWDKALVAAEKPQMESELQAFIERGG